MPISPDIARCGIIDSAYFPVAAPGGDLAGDDKKFLIKIGVDSAIREWNIAALVMKHPILPSLGALLVLSTLAQAATLEVDKQRSRIQVNAKATGHSFSGTLKDYKTTVSGDEKSLDPSAFDLSWSFSNLDTDDAKRDAEMIKWLGGGAPKGSFKFTKSWTDKAGKTQCMGDLTINGVSKTIAFPYSAKKDGDWVTIDGKVTMDYQNFKLPIIRAMAVMTVDPKLEVTFHVVGKVK